MILLTTPEGRKRIIEVLADFFESMTVEGGSRPKKGYATKIRSSIRAMILEEYKVDITNPEQFPEFAKMWKGYCDTLSKEGLAETEHKEEVPPETIQKIYKLLWRVKLALENRGSEDYVEKYLAPIPPHLHTQLHRLLQWGAEMILVFYEVRRGQENLDELKAADFREVEDEKFDFKYLKKFISEQDKNHRAGTNVQCSGVIPFVNIINDEDDCFFNPAEYFSFYLKFVPFNASKPAKEGGYLFPRPRKVGNSLDIHKAGEMHLYKANMKGTISIHSFYD